MPEGREVGVAEGAQESVGDGGGTALQRRDRGDLHRRAEVGGLMRPVESPAEVLAAQEAIRDLVETALVEGRDYMRIPGTDKDTLVKPGAERIQMAFGAYSDFEIVEKEVDHDRETRYTKERWETVDKPTLEDGGGEDRATIDRMKAEGTGRFRKDGNAWVWQERTIIEGVSYGVYRYVIRCNLVSRKTGVVIGAGIGVASTMESKYIDRPRDLENTIAKMAKKRAQIDAVLSTFGLSEMFTQDLDDMSGGPTSTAPSGGGAPRSSSSGAGGPKFLDSKVSETISAAKDEVRDLTWRECIEEDRGYVGWVVGNYRSISDQQRNTLRAALKQSKERKESAEAQDGPRITKDQIKEARSLGKELGVSDNVEKFIRRNPSEDEAKRQIARAKLQIAEQREAEGAGDEEAEERVPGEDDEEPGAEAEAGEDPASVFDEDDELPFD